MSEPEFDRDDQDPESMFDFLAEEGAEKQRRKKRTDARSERSLPIIRKPVPVSESGPLLPPKPGAPVEPPPTLTGGPTKTNEDLAFLDDVPETAPSGKYGRTESDADSKITRLDPRSRRAARARPSKGSKEPRRVVGTPPGHADDFDTFDGLDLDLDDAPEFARNRKTARSVSVDNYDFDDEARPKRGRWLLLALVLLVAGGAGSYIVTGPPDWRGLLAKLGMDSTQLDGSGRSASVGTDNAACGDDAGVVTPSPLMQRFMDQLALVEGLIADGALDDAEQALSTMDRTVYGYGVSEFEELKNRIEQIRSGNIPAVANNEQAERDEAARIAAEQAAKADSERLAAAEAAREAEAREAEAREAEAREAEAREAEARAAEERAARDEQARAAAAARAAQEQAAQEEQARAVADAEAQAAREEQARVAAEARAAEERAASEEQARITAETRAAEEQAARAAEQARLAARNARTSDWQSVDADRQATDRRIAAERAALQRQQAREQRLIEARQREEALAKSQNSATDSSAAVPGSTARPAPEALQSESPAVVEQPAQQVKAIDDDELQTVYRRFIDLQQAISNRDINAVVRLTQRSGVRVQQLMQIFENSTQIDARIRNVSTSNATGQIKGTLQINRIRRADGTFVQPPAALSAIPLSSQREGDGWSAISW